MRESPFENYINYFEDIANRHPLIKWFHEIELEEIISGQLRSTAKPPCLFLEFPEPELYDNRTNTDIKLPSGLAILEPVRKGDMPAIREIMIRTEIIILDIISKMREDRRTGKQWTNTNELKYTKVSNMFADNWTGWRLDLKPQVWVDLNYFPDQWNEYDPDKFN